MSGDFKKIVYLIIGILLISLIGSILWGYLSNAPQEPPKQIQQEIKKDQVKVDNKTTTKTTYQYVPKTSPVDADVEVVSDPKPIVVSINGTKHEVPTDTVKETHKLDNGKLVVTEERQVELKLTVPEQPKFKKGVYIENDLTRGTQDITVGVRASYQTREFDVDLKAELWTKKNDKDKRIEATVTKWF